MSVRSNALPVAACLVLIDADNVAWVIPAHPEHAAAMVADWEAEYQTPPPAVPFGQVRFFSFVNTTGPQELVISVRAPGVPRFSSQEEADAWLAQWSGAPHA